MTGQNLFLNVMVSTLILALFNILSVDIQIHARKYEKKKLIIDIGNVVLVLVISLISLVVGITVLVCSAIIPSMGIEDKNGIYDTHLSVIDEFEILSTVNHYSALGRYMSVDGAKTNVSGKLNKFDYDEILFSCQKIDGVITLQATKTKQDEVKLEIITQSKMGNLEIAVIVDNQIFETIMANESKTIVLNEVTDKTILVKLAGESANADISIRRFVGG